MSAKRTDEKGNDTGVETGARSYYLKETSAPEGYKLNENVVQIRVTKDSIYANAGKKDDGIQVAKGVGYLVKTVARYASAAHINITLRDIIATEYLLPAHIEDFETFTPGDDRWEFVEGSELKLHYKLNEAGGVDGYNYGIHHEDNPSGDKKPYYITDKGWVGFAVKQNFGAHSDKNDPYYSDDAKENLIDPKVVDLSHLLTGMTTVMVTDPKDNTGSLTVNKTDEKDNKKLSGAEFKLEYISKDEYEKIPGAGLLKDVAVAETEQSGISEAIKKKLEDLRTQGQEFEFVQHGGILTTNDEGVIATASLPEGIYRLIETKAPDGYVTDNTPIYFVISIPKEGNTDVNLVLNVTNKRLVMPNTGGTGTGRYYLYGMSLIGTALLMEQERRRRRRRAVRRY